MKKLLASCEMEKYRINSVNFVHVLNAHELKYTTTTSTRTTTATTTTINTFASSYT